MIKKDDYVTRKSYDNDIVFKVLKDGANDLYASFRVVELDELTHSMYFATEAPQDIGRQMVYSYFEDISKATGLLSQKDWPFSMDGAAFWDALRGGGYMRDRFTVTREEGWNDVFIVRAKCCSTYGNAGQVYAAVIKLLNYHFPELNVKKIAAGPSSMYINVKV